MNFKIWMTKIVRKINASKLFWKLPTKLRQKIRFGLVCRGLIGHYKSSNTGGMACKNHNRLEI